MVQHGGSTNRHMMQFHRTTSTGGSTTCCMRWPTGERVPTGAGRVVNSQPYSRIESFAELIAQSQAFLAKLKPGAIVTGTVVEVRGDVVVINAGLKSEGIVPIEQFRNDDGEIDVGVGDQVKVALDAIENGFGETVL